MSQIDSITNKHICETLGATPTFRDVSHETIKALVDKSTLLLLPAGKTLFHVGESFHQVVYTLIEGEVVKLGPSNRERLMGPGEFIGLANYIDQHDYLASAHTVKQTSLLVTESGVLNRLEHSRQDFFDVVSRIIAGKLRERNPDRSISAGVLAQPVTRVMKSPVAYCGPETNLRQAFQTMKARLIGSMVVIDKNEKLLGLLTHAGLAEAVLLNNSRPDDSIMTVACEVPRVVKPDTPLWKAEDLMEQDGVKYVIVCENNQPIGIISQTDILRALVARPSTLTNRISEALSIQDLVELSGKLPIVATDAIETNRLPSAAVRLLSETHLMLQRKVVELTLEWMKQKGYGKPPADYAILIMGSGGRREMLLNPDQDNGIIIDQSDDDKQKQTELWFDRFAKRLNRNLSKVGYDFCPGEIMMRNPTYRKSLDAWKQQIEDITNKPSQQNARWANVVFDFDTLYGNDRLTSELRRHLLAELRKKPGLLKSMAEDDAEGKPALGIFNQLVTTKDEKGEHIDVKRNGLRIIADVARIFALQNGVAVQNTADRLNALVKVGKLSEDFKNSIQEAYEEMLDLLLNQQLKQVNAGKTPMTKIKLDKLSSKNRSTLRMAMRAVKRFQDLLQDEYSGEIF